MLVLAAPSTSAADRPAPLAAPALRDRRGAFTLGLYHALNVGSDLTGTRGLIFVGDLAAPVLWLVYARILMPRSKPRPALPRTPPVRRAPRQRRPLTPSADAAVPA